MKLVFHVETTPLGLSKFEYKKNLIKNSLVVEKKIKFNMWSHANISKTPFDQKFPGYPEVGVSRWHTHTDRQTNVWTWRLYDWPGLEGRVSENILSKFHFPRCNHIYVGPFQRLWRHIGAYFFQQQKIVLIGLFWWGETICKNFSFQALTV